MNIKTNLLAEDVTFVDTTKKQNTYFKIFINLIVVCFLSIFVFIFRFIRIPK